MENIGSVNKGKKAYGKPMTLRIEMDKNLCDGGNMCGLLGAVVTSTSRDETWQICVHFPRNAIVQGVGIVQAYSKSDGIITENEVRKITIKGEHVIQFLGAPSGVYTDSSITDGSTGAVGWQQYSTSGNGDCHYFGQISVDGHIITSTSVLPEGVTEGGW